jgi:hypothetical protein
MPSGLKNFILREKWEKNTNQIIINSLKLNLNCQHRYNLMIYMCVYIYVYTNWREKLANVDMN